MFRIEIVFLNKSRLYYSSDFPPHHFLRFSYKAIYEALKLVGFKNIEIYYTDFPYKELFPIIEKDVLGNIDNIKLKIKTIIFKNEELAQAVLVNNLSKLENIDKLRLNFIKSLKFLRNLLLFPFTLFYIKKLKNNGLSFYFQAQYLNI